MNPELITLIFNILLGAFVVLGFLFGLRGIKKSTYNFVVFLIKTIVVFILTPVFSKIALGISISGKTIEFHIYDTIVDAMGPEMASSSFMSALIEALPIMIVNIAVFIALYIALAIVFKIIAVIVYKIMFRKDKQKVVEKVEIVNGTPQMVKNTVNKKKHRLWGGLVGAAHGFLFILILLFPVVGLANIFNDVSGVSKVQAETETVQIQYFDELLRDNLPKEVVNYAKALDNSIIFKIGKVGGLAETSFNLVAKSNINGKSVSLGKEIRSFANAYNAMVSFTRSSNSILTDYSLEAIYNNLLNNPNDFDFEMLYNAIDKLFDSSIIEATGNDALKFIADMLVENAQDAQSLKLMTHIKTAIYAYANAGNSLKDDFKAMVSLFETSAKSGLLKILDQENITLSDVKPILLNEANAEQNKPENEVLNKLTQGVTNSKLFQKILIELTNYGLEELEVEIGKLQLNGTEPVSIKEIDSSKNYELTSNELSKIFVDFIALSEEIELIDEDAVQEDPFNIFDIGIESIIKKVGNILNDIVSLSMLKNSGVFASICEEMARTEYNTYISFETLKGSNVVSAQFNNLAEAVAAIKDSGIISEIRYIKNIDDGADRIKSIIAKLAEQTNGTTMAQKIVEPLLKCDIFKNAIVYGLEEANKYVEAELIKINPNASLNAFNTENLLTEEENVKLVNLINNLVQFADGVTLSKILTSEFIDELLDIDAKIVNLGNALDAIQQSNLFADYDGKDGVYKNIMNALAEFETFSDFFDFEAATSSEFSWSSRTGVLNELKKDLDSVTILDDGKEVKLLKYILTFGDYNKLIDGLYGKEVNLTKLFEIDILKPTAVKVINLINSAIKDYIDQNVENEENKLGTNIIPIDKTANIKDQAASINNVINKALKLDFSGTHEVNGKLELERLCDLLDALEENAENNGVFKEAYNALLLKMTNEINLSIKNFIDDNDITEDIIMLTPEQNVSEFKEDIINIIKASSNFNVDDLNNIANIDKTAKQDLNELLDCIKTASNKENSPFANTYNALLVGCVNAINSYIQEITAKAGSKITYITEKIILTGDEENAIRNLLNNVIDVVASGKITSINLASADTATIFNVVDLFNNNNEIANGIFAETSNALLVYIINTINSAVGNEVGLTLTVFDGDAEPDYTETKTLLEKGKDVFKLMQENKKDFVEISTTDEFDAFVVALESAKNYDYTHQTKQALDIYLAKQASI